MQERDYIADSVIGIDATTAVGPELSGVGKYSRRLIAELKKAYPRTAFRSYYRPHRFLRADFPKRLLFQKTPGGLDVFHGLNQRLPRLKRAPSVTTVHDLFVLSGDYSTPEFQRRFAGQAREAAAQSNRIIAVSQFTANQVVALLAFTPDRVRVVPHGVDPPAAVAPMDGRRPIVLTVGAIQKRKNTRRLIEAMRAMSPQWELWIAGSLGFEGGEMLAALPRNRTVRLLGYVSDDALAKLYAEASIFAFPSLDEGFGIPVLEAMANGVPVLTSNCSALPEVAGAAAILVNPQETDAIAEGLRQLEDEGLRRRYRMLGIERAKAFTWANSARLTADVYGELIDRPHPGRF